MTPQWIHFPSGARVHATAILGMQPMQSPTFARPVAEYPAPTLYAGVTIAPYAIIYAGCIIGANTQVCPQAHIREGVQIGENCVIGVGVRIGYNAIIGNNVQIMDDTHISGGTIIGDGTFVSVHVVAVNDDRPAGYVWKGVTPVTIGKGCVIGAGAKLRPGVKIGDGATVAMGAVVTRDVPAGAMVKGMPAREEVANLGSLDLPLTCGRVEPVDKPTAIAGIPMTKTFGELSDAELNRLNAYASGWNESRASLGARLMAAPGPFAVAAADGTAGWDAPHASPVYENWP